ncbi:hypothetical protein [Polaribacter sp. Q13]|uniref:hypothetical protein n=1 Tax=Polaribacter sp. Q13 TaxID=2806551 RepID=UPI00193B8093|nr:hypothetical protein [Polaribacter sp. Q13]QVY65695.1 hypothetical protein JOP69_18500 [Polaribacter sp. Q13]
MQVNNEQSESQIIQNRSINEVKRWMLDLSEISSECNDLELERLKEMNLRNEFSTIIENNKMIRNTLLEYKNVLNKPTECIDLECDLFFYNEHKKNRNLYIEHLNNYKSLKNNMV